jgi:hypothetical protein
VKKGTILILEITAQLTNEHIAITYERYYSTDEISISPGGIDKWWGESLLQLSRCNGNELRETELVYLVSRSAGIGGEKLAHENES